MITFQAGGWGMYPTLAFGVLGIVAGLIYAVRPERRFVPLVVTTSFLTLATGSFGFVVGCIITATSVTSGDRSLAVVGVGESLNNIGLALACVIFALLAVSLGAVRIAVADPSGRVAAQ